MTIDAAILGGIGTVIFIVFGIMSIKEGFWNDVF